MDLPCVDAQREQSGSVDQDVYVEARLEQGMQLFIMLEGDGINIYSCINQSRCGQSWRLYGWSREKRKVSQRLESFAIGHWRGTRLHHIASACTRRPLRHFCSISSRPNYRLSSTCPGSTPWQTIWRGDRVCDFHRISNRWVRAGPDRLSTHHSGRSINVWYAHALVRKVFAGGSIG